MNIPTSLKVLAIAASLLPTAAFAEDDQTVTVTIPSSGHLAFKSDRNFTGPSAIIVSNFYGSANANSKGLVFNNQQLGEDVVLACYANSSSGLILTAQPGTYTLTLTDRTATKQFFSTGVSWVDEAGTVDESSRQRAVYKFVNETGRVGFERDETYAGDNYYKCDMAEGEHVYFAIGDKNLERICDTMQTTAAELSFIPWSQELWGCPVIDTSADISTTEYLSRDTDLSSPDAHYRFDLQGRRAGSEKGVYILNGKKYIK